MTSTIHRHWKGKLYLEVGRATDADDEQEHVLYRCLYDTPSVRTWSRTRARFEELVAPGTVRFTPMFRLDAPTPEEDRAILAFGHDAWGKGRELETFVASYETNPNHRRGRRYVLRDLCGEPLAKLNLLDFGRDVFGLASVATAPQHRKRGHARLLVRSVLELVRARTSEAARFLLFSEVPPSVYEPCGFRVLEDAHQQHPPGIAMATGDEPLGPYEAGLLETYF